LYFHAHYLPAFILLSLFTGLWRSDMFKWETFNQGIFYAALALTSAVEVVRIYFGFTGNLNEKLPHIAGFCLVSVFPQIPLHIYFSAFQPNPTSLDIAILVVQWIFLALEIVCGLVTAARLVRYQTSKYYLHFTAEGTLIT